jgi:hypothetical protein
VKVDFKDQPQFEIIRYLYQFKEDNKFYKLEECLPDVPSNKEIYKFIYNLRDSAFIGTDCEVYQTNEGHYFPEQFDNGGEIRARILPKGVAAIESILKKDGSNISY